MQTSGIYSYSKKGIFWKIDTFWTSSIYQISNISRYLKLSTRANDEKSVSNCVKVPMAERNWD